MIVGSAMVNHMQIRNGVVRDGDKFRPAWICCVIKFYCRRHKLLWPFGNVVVSLRARAGNAFVKLARDERDCTKQ